MGRISFQRSSKIDLDQQVQHELASEDLEKLVRLRDLEGRSPHRYEMPYKGATIGLEVPRGCQAGWNGKLRGKNLIWGQANPRCALDYVKPALPAYAVPRSHCECDFRNRVIRRESFVLRQVAMSTCSLISTP
jgi:hypothetical protein